MSGDEQDFWGAMTGKTRRPTRAASSPRRPTRAASSPKPPRKKTKSEANANSSSAKLPTQGARPLDSPLILDATISELIGKLSGAEKENLVAFYNNLTVSTGCSGTDQCVIVLKRVAKQTDGNVDQTMACEQETLILFKEVAFVTGGA